MTERPSSLVSLTGTTELVDVVNLVAQAIFAQLRQSGRVIEPTQWATMRIIASGSWTMSELARRKAVSLPTMSKSIDMLERRAWVERVVDEDDRRQTLVRLTADGRTILAECRQQAETAVARSLARLSEGDREALGASLRVLRDALRDDVTRR